MKKLHIDTGLALLAALAFLAFVSTATTFAVAEGYNIEMAAIAPTQ